MCLEFWVHINSSGFFIIAGCLFFLYVNYMSIQLIIRLVSYFIFVLLLTTIKLRNNKIKQRIGVLLLPLPAKRHKLVVVVFIIAPLLIVLQRFRSFELYMSIVLSACALLGTEIGIRDLVLGGMTGVYENGIVIDSRYIPYDSISSLPTLAYENDSDTTPTETLAADAKETAAKTLKIVTEKSGITFVGFDSAENRNAAVAIILERNPRLKP